MAGQVTANIHDHHSYSFHGRPKLRFGATEFVAPIADFVVLIDIYPGSIGRAAIGAVI